MNENNFIEEIEKEIKIIDDFIYANTCSQLSNKEKMVLKIILDRLLKIEKKLEYISNYDLR